jgi:uncharacterized protein DUF3365
MRRRWWLSAVAALALWHGAAAAQDDVKERTNAARAAAMDFGKTLLGELQKAMASGGPVAAIGVCNVEAPAIASEKSAAMHMTIARTSLKLRQPKNAPDEWELRQLQSFEQRKAAGENPAQIEIGEYVERDGKKLFRYMKAIPTGEICVSCHGAALAPDVSAKLKELYPKDTATGFKVGDLRGAFTITEAP